MNDILNISNQIQFDDRITKVEYRRILPYNTLTYNHNDELRFQIQHQEHFILPSESYIYIEGRVVHTDDSASDITKVHLVKNAPAFFFDEARYNICGKEIDRTRNVGITSTLKILSTRNTDEALSLSNGGWSLKTTQETSTVGDFNFCFRLDNIFGFANDYKAIIPNAQHELILQRSKNDDNSCRLLTAAAFKFRVSISKIEWRVPYIFLNDVEKLQLYDTINIGRPISIAFRAWDFHEYPLLPKTTKHQWTVKTSTQLEKPRYIFFAMQTLRKDVVTADSTQFDSNKLQEFSVYLNDEKYPNFDLNLDFGIKRVGVLYELLTNFQKSFRGSTCHPQMSVKEFMESPFIVIDCSRQNEVMKSGVVDIRIEFKTSANIPASTAAYCVIVHDRVIDYYPLENRVETHI